MAYLLTFTFSQACTDLSPVPHGKVSDTSNLHAQGDMESGLGAIGGPMFSACTGKLLGMCVGNDQYGKKTVFVPTLLALKFAMECQGAGGVFAYTA